METLLLLGLMATGFAAGTVGAFFGVGGGVIVVPALTILFGFTAQEAAAVSLVGIAASSSYAAAFFLTKNLVNIRLGIILMVATVIGSVIGAMFSAYLEQWLLLALFALVMAYSGFYMIHNPERLSVPQGKEGRFQLRYCNCTEVGGCEVEYTANHLPSALLISSGSGALSSLVGIGGGSVNVPLMNVWMGIPIKVSTSTSSLMICVTAMSGAIIYYMGGTLLPLAAAGVTLGMVAGSYIGAHSTRFFDGRSLRRHFSIFMFFIAVITMMKAGGLL